MCEEQTILSETELAMIDEFEAQTGLEYDYDGPLPCECDECGGLIQYMQDHSCYYVLAETEAARRFNEMAYGG